MIARRRVLVVWAVLAVLIGVVVAVEYGDALRAKAAGGASADDRALLPVPVAEIGAVEIADAGTRHRFERDAAGAWFYHGAHGGAEGAHAHAADPVASARIEKALAAFGRTRIERRLPRGSDPRAYGLTAPRMVILVYRAREAQPLAQYAVGDVAPDAISRYVDAVGGAGVVTIPGYQVDNLVALVDALKAAP